MATLGRPPKPHRIECTKCGTVNPGTDKFFPKDSRKLTGLSSWCRKCKTASFKEWRKRHPIQYAATQKRNREKNGRTYDLRKLYGIDAQIYDAILNAQGGVCAICGVPAQNSAKRRLAVDHSHTTGSNRGLLCTMCNHALERVGNDPDWGSKALNYLARYIEQTVKG